MAVEVSTTTGLWIALIVIALMIFATFYSNGFRQSFSRTRLLLRTLAILLLGLVLCRPMITDEKEVTDIELLVDISDSMDEARGQALLDKAAELVNDGFRIAIRPFAGDVSPLVERGARAFDYMQLKDSWSRLDIGATNLERAIEEVAYKKDSRLLLITDGNETRGDSERILPVMKGNQVQIFPLALSTGSEPQETVRITQLHAPFIVPASQEAEVRISVANTTSDIRRGRLLVKHDESELFNEIVDIPRAQEVLFTTDTDASLEGIKEITATFTPEDTIYPVSSGKTFISGEERERVLLLSGVSQDEQFLKKVLTDQSYQLDAFTSSGIRLENLPDLSKYSAVILNNIPLDELPLGAGTKLQNYTAEGGGLMMLGGNKSFGLGGYIDSPIEDILPVEILPPQKEKKRLNVAVQLVMDKSGSMKQGGKINFARLAAKEVVKALKPEDYFGLVAFDDAPFTVQPIGRVGQIRARALRAPDDLMHPTGTTNLFPALDMALEFLSKVPAGRKHLIILTDGKIPDGYTNAPLYDKIVRDKRMFSGITVSTFLIGDDSGELLRALANTGGGAFHRTNNAQTLPRLFLNDVKVNTGERTQREASQYDVRKGPAGVKSTSLSSFPAIKGYVQTKSRQDAKLELVTNAEGKAEPLLASWNYKKGKAVAFTSDVSGRWSQHWIKWNRFSEFWTDLIDSVRPDSGEDDAGVVKFDLRPFVEKGHLTFDLAVYTEGIAGDVVLDIQAPDDSNRELPLRSIARGRFQGSLDSLSAGKYVVAGKIGSRKLTPIAFHVSGELFGERKDQGINLAALEHLAGYTGGVVNPDADLLSGILTREIVKKNITHWCFILALLLFLLDIILRESWMFRRIGSRLKPVLQTFK